MLEYALKTVYIFQLGTVGHYESLLKDLFHIQ